MKYQIKSRWTGSVLFEVDADSLKIALRIAVESGANLYGANLRDADLRDADLYGANLYGANLRDADLRDADLRGANLCDANLRGANLRGANLRGANLYDADLRGANLYGADLRDANLEGEKLIIAPIQIIGMEWTVTITPEYIRIGCQRYKVDEWEKFGDEDIKLMHPNAVKFWNTYKDIILSAHKIHKKEAGK